MQFAIDEALHKLHPVAPFGTLDPMKPKQESQ